MKLSKSESSTYELNEVQEHLLVKGFQLSEEDIMALKHTQEQACQMLGMVEMNEDKFTQIIKPFTTLPYLTIEHMLKRLQESIYLYYSIRSRFDWHLSDEECIDAIHQATVEGYGVIDKQLIQTICFKLKQEGYTNHDNEIDF